MLDGLIDRQREAVTAPDGPTLVLAGAGTGKTRVLAHRVAYLVHDRHVEQWSIIALTFTNKAAREMRDRISSLLGMQSRVWVGTFHAFGLWVLRRNHELAGLPPEFAVCGVSDQLDIVKGGMDTLGISTKRFKPRDLLRDIRWIKKRMIEQNDEGGQDDTLSFMPHAAELFRYYIKYCADNGLVDFDDLLYRPLALLKDNPDIREKYQERCRYLLIDEYQDTNRIQFQMARILTAKYSNLFAVGDEDQSIYGWRGADMRNVTQFSKSFPNSRVIRLEQNYRSTQNILDAANSLIKKNTERIGKRLWTDTGSGEKVVLYRATDAEDEARWVADTITSMDRPKGDFAVLFRTNAQSREFEKEFVLRGIPHELVAGTRFYNRREIKDVMAYLRVSVRPQDDLSLTRVLTVGAYGIGPKTIESARALVGDDVSLFDALRTMSRESDSPRPAIAKFVAFIEQLQHIAQTYPVFEAVESIIKKSGYLNKLEKEKAPDKTERIENVNELLNAVREYADDDDDQEVSLIGFLNEVALVSDVDSWREGECGVSVMTIHAAKGLEFPVVFVVGLEEGLMPHSMSLRDNNLEEERRLCYVAMTRAKEQLYLSAADKRIMYGGAPRSTKLSRFLSELPRDRLEVYSILKDDSDADSSDTDSFQQLRVGTRVRHRKFGAGTVLYTAGKGRNEKVKVKFRNGRIKVFMVAYAGFEVLG